MSTERYLTPARGLTLTVTTPNRSAPQVLNPIGVASSGRPEYEVSPYSVVIVAISRASTPCSFSSAISVASVMVPAPVTNRDVQGRNSLVFQPQLHGGGPINRVASSVYVCMCVCVCVCVCVDAPKSARPASESSIEQKLRSRVISMWKVRGASKPNDPIER